MNNPDALKADPRAFLPVIMRCRELLLPTIPGTYKVKIEGDFSLDEDESNYSTKIPVDAQITLAKDSLPVTLDDVQILTKLPIVRATVKASGSLKATIPHPKTGKPVEVELDDPEESGLFIPCAAVQQALWETFHVNKYSLDAMLAAISYEHYQSYQQEWHDTKLHLVKRAFGHDPEIPTKLFDYVIRDNMRGEWGFPNFIPEGNKLFPCQAASYYPLSAVYYLVAFLYLVKNKDLPLALPSNDCAITFGEDGQERADIYLLDTWEGPKNPPMPLEARKDYGKTAEGQIMLLFRNRQELLNTREKRRKLLEEMYSLGEAPNALVRALSAGKYIRVLSDADRSKQEQLQKEIRGLYEQNYDLQDKLLTLYADLTQWASKFKEGILKAVRAKDKVSMQIVAAKAALKAREFVSLPNNMDKLPAHFAAIPSGLESGLQMATDQYGRAIMRVRRKGLEIVGAQQPAQEQIPFTLPLWGLADLERKSLEEQANKLFGPNGPRWLVPQGIVAVSKLYSDNGGYSGVESVVRLHLNDWIDTMRPLQIARFKEKGRGEAFGKEQKPRDLFFALLGILNRLTYDSRVMPDNPEWSELSGFYLITASGEDARGPWTEVVLNPSLHKFITGEGGLPYMITNTQAMFSYDRASLDYTPAAQMGVEQLARNIMLKTDTATLQTGGGDGFTRLALAQRFGILRGPKEDNTRVLERFTRVLNNLTDAGVLAEWKTDGKDKRGADAFGVKLHLTMHEDYRKAYNLTRMQTLEKELNKQLAAPFAISKPKKGATFIQHQAKKKRGRPAKQR